MSKEGFSTKKYLEVQGEKFAQALSREDGQPAFLEFGGKPFTDHHAERVMPGYDAECKAEILREMVKLADIVMVVNALDILVQPDGRKPKGRIRGDSGLLYDKEVIRLVDRAHTLQIPMRKVVLAVTPEDMTSDSKRRIDQFRHDLEMLSVELLVHHQISGYPNTEIFEKGENPFKHNDLVRVDDGNLVVVSPGGGSGKFGVLLSEMYNSLIQDQTPHYVKFETFPIYQLDAEHALNMAFEAATADLGNKVLDLRREQEKASGVFRTSYDKDVENLALLKKMFALFGKTDKLFHMRDAVDMGINRVVDGITDMNVIVDACRAEIIARVLRYEQELGNGIEEITTVEAARDVLGRFDAIYGVTSK